MTTDLKSTISSLSPEKRAELKGILDGLEPSAGEKLFSGPNVKLPSERYSKQTYPAKHVKTGQVVRHKGEDVYLPSERENALTGVYFKELARRGGQAVAFSEHESELLKEVYAGEWKGCLPGSEEVKTFSGSTVKALISDATSGGLEVNPAWFDARLVTTPLLYAEVLPWVDVVDVPRSNRVEGASVSNPTVTWNINEGTEIPVFDTSSMVSAIDTSMFPVVCGIEIGRDMMSDSPADLGRIVIENIGQSMAATLDFVIVDGDGTTQPQGILNSGITDLGNPSGGAGAAPTIDDYLGHIFGLAKQYRTPNMRVRFLMSDTAYKYGRSINVGASDERLVLGNAIQDYKIFDIPVSIMATQNNAEVAICAMSKYRLYRRAGASVEITSEGKELRLKNLSLITVRGRFGGRLMDTSAGKYSDSWKA